MKIMLTVRNRLSITQKCIQSIEKNAVENYQIFVYENLSNYKIEEHFEYFGKLYKEGRISQVTFNTKESTFNAFSKAVSSNMFGLQHESDPDKDKVDTLLILDNDVIIIHKKFDKLLRRCWKDIKRKKMKNIKIIGQRPGGIKHTQPVEGGIAGVSCIQGRLGGSGLWCLKPDFYNDIGYLSLKSLVGKNKMHDQLTWSACEKATKGQPYIIGLTGKKIAVHCGKTAGSICNNLTKIKNKSVMEKIKFKEADKEIEEMSYDEFLAKIKNDKYLMNDW
jgi:hypothetical protein